MGTINHFVRPTCRVLYENRARFESRPKNDTGISYGVRGTTVRTIHLESIRAQLVPFDVNRVSAFVYVVVVGNLLTVGNEGIRMKGIDVA